METGEQTTALEIAERLETWATKFGMHPSGSVPSAAKELRRLHTRNQELEAMLEAVGAGGVSAQRVTQSQPLKASSDWLIDGGLLYRLNDEGTNCDEINVTMAGGLRTEAARVERAGEILNMLKAVQQAEDCIEQPLEMVAAPAELNLDDYYCKGCGRIGEIEELNAQDKEKLRKIEGKPKTVAAPVEVVIDFERVGSAGPFEVVEGRVAIPVVTMLDLARWLKPTTDALPAALVELPEPEAYLFQHDGTGQTMFVEAQQVDWGFEANNPRLHKVYGLYTEQQVREFMAAHGITQKKRSNDKEEQQWQ